MIKVYKLDKRIRDALESLEIYKEKEEDKAEELNVPLRIKREDIEKEIENHLSQAQLEYRKIRREKTTTYVMTLKNPDTNNDEDVKMTIKFEQNGFYSSHRYYNITFHRDFEFYVGDEDDFCLK